jgi:glycosyltransferase involved in cell wall biosynthesis
MNISSEQVIVSVLMTAFNREEYIGEAIESVLASSIKEFELIIVDDCSSDRTVEIALSYQAKDSRIRIYINEKNLGDYPNRNKAAAYAKGKYLKYLDSDDVMYPHCLEVMVTAMERYPNSAFGLSSTSNKNYPYPISVSPRDSYEQHFGGFGHFDRAPGSSIIKREIFVKENGFLIPKYAGDTELWFRLAQKYDLVLFPRDLVWDRCHSQTQSNLERLDKNIGKFRRGLIHDFLRSSDCPLNENDVKKIKMMESKNRIKQIFRIWI